MAYRKMAAIYIEDRVVKIAFFITIAGCFSVGIAEFALRNSFDTIVSACLCFIIDYYLSMLGEGNSTTWKGTLIGTSFLLCVLSISIGMFFSSNMNSLFNVVFRTLQICFLVFLLIRRHINLKRNKYPQVGKVTFLQVVLTTVAMIAGLAMILTRFPYMLFGVGILCCGYILISKLNQKQIDAASAAYRQEYAAKVKQGVQTEPSFINNELVHSEKGSTNSSQNHSIRKDVEVHESRTKPGNGNQAEDRANRRNIETLTDRTIMGALSENDADGKSEEYSIKLWFNSAQGMVDGKRVHVGEEATYYPKKRSVVIRNWGPNGTEENKIVVSDKVDSKGSVILYLDSLGYHVPKRVLQETLDNRASQK